MDIEEGGQLEKFSEPKILRSIKIHKSDSGKRVFEFWLNDDSLTYLSLKELLNLRDEITEAIEAALKL